MATLSSTPQKKATIEQVEQLVGYVGLCIHNARHLHCCSPSYVAMLVKVERHMRVRLARGEFSEKD